MMGKVPLIGGVEGMQRAAAREAGLRQYEAETAARIMASVISVFPSKEDPTGKIDLEKHFVQCARYSVKAARALSKELGLRE